MKRYRVPRGPYGTLAVAASWLVAWFPVCADDSLPAVELPKVEVTGSHVPRLEGETALPVQVINREQIERSGVTTTAELMSRVAANVGGFNDQLSIGSQLALSGTPSTPGLSSVNLRALGNGSTLVLVNGRRLQNYAFDGAAVDVNAIPLAAVQRVEILKDGASAIYGSDAMAGVVNFILRRDYQGAEVGINASSPQHPGGSHRQATALFGRGDPASDRFNVFALFDLQRDDEIRSIDRPFARTGYLPSKGLVEINPQTFPANINLGPGRGFLSPALAAGCNPPGSIVAALPPQLPPSCVADFASQTALLPHVDRSSVFARASFQSTQTQQLFIEAGYTRNVYLLRFPATPVAQQALFQQQAPIYPAGGPYYPTDFAAANGISGDLNLRLRLDPLGPRTNQVDSRAERLVIGAEGEARGWDYRTAVLHSVSRQHDHYVSGWVSQQQLLPALATGLINPFGASGPEGDALLASTQVGGDLHHAQGTTTLVDLKASRDVGRLADRATTIAFGVEARSEHWEDLFAPIINSGDLIGVGGVHDSVSASRGAQAAYAELVAPFTHGLEAQIAARFDHYSDFGNSTNPKIALRWQPAPQWLLRGSWGTGFRAPTLRDVHTPTSHGTTVETQDPVRCPVTGSASDCDLGFPAVFGGNSSLQPETSRQLNLGAVWQPASLRLSLDAWRIEKRHTIGLIPESSLFAYPGQFASNFVRGRVDPAFPNLPGPIESVIEIVQNTGNLQTSGLDVGVEYRGPMMPMGRFGIILDGTYVASWRQQLDGVNYMSGVGVSLLYPIPRWRHSLSATWDSGPWSATLSQTFQSSYAEPDQTKCDADGNCLNRNIGTYELWDVFLAYSVWKGARITVGVTNIFDRAPPFVQSAPTFTAGYDASYGEPRGRTYRLSIKAALP